MANLAAHEAHLNEHADMVMCRAPMLTDDGVSPVGSVILRDVPDLDAARTLIHADPFFRTGCYREIRLHRWSFAQGFDRLDAGSG